MWASDSLATNLFQWSGGAVNTVSRALLGKNLVMNRGLANEQLAATMEGEAGYGAGLDELMKGLYGEDVIRSGEGGGYTKLSTGQQITSIDQATYNVYIQTKDMDWSAAQEEIKRTTAAGVYS